MNIAEVAASLGWPEAEVARGLWPAVEEFLAAHPFEWMLRDRFTNNNGLTVLERLAPLDTLKAATPLTDALSSGDAEKTVQIETQAAVEGVNVQPLAGENGGEARGVVDSKLVEGSASEPVLGKTKEEAEEERVVSSAGTSKPSESSESSEARRVVGEEVGRIRVGPAKKRSSSKLTGSPRSEQTQEADNKNTKNDEVKKDVENDVKSDPSPTQRPKADSKDDSKDTREKSKADVEAAEKTTADNSQRVEPTKSPSLKGWFGLF